MKTIEQSLVHDSILDSWRIPLATDFTAYSNRCYRVLNFCVALSENNRDAIAKISIAAAFHDLGIWVNKTFDYLEPSKQLARAYLANSNQSSWNEEIETMIEQHHKIRKYKTNPPWLVESFRKADWIDLSKGMLRFGLSASYVASVIDQFPNSGFHRRLVTLTKQRLITHPFRPLPMIKF